MELFTEAEAAEKRVQQIHDAGHNVPELTGQLVNQAPLDDTPAQDLRYRLVGYLPDESAPAHPARAADGQGVEQQEHTQIGRYKRPDTGPRR